MLGIICILCIILIWYNGTTIFINLYEKKELSNITKNISVLVISSIILPICINI